MDKRVYASILAENVINALESALTNVSYKTECLLDHEHIEKCGVFLSDKEEACGMYLNLDMAYEKYICGKLQSSQLLAEEDSDIIESFNQIDLNTYLQLHGITGDLSKIKYRIYYRIVNYNTTGYSLKGSLVYLCGDMALVIFIDLSKEGNLDVVIDMPLALLHRTCVDKMTILRIAINNTIEKLGFRLDTLGNEYKQSTLRLSDEPVVLSNEYSYYGLSALMYPGLLKEISYQSDTDIIIIVVSVHCSVLIRKDAVSEVIRNKLFMSEISRLKGEGIDYIYDKPLIYSRKTRGLEDYTF